MASNHSVTKPNRRNKNSRRKDYTQATMHALRSPEAQARALTQAQEIADSAIRDLNARAKRKAEKEAKQLAMKGGNEI